MPNPVQRGDNSLAGTSNIFVGLMSGTSMDGIDAAVVEFESNRCRVLASSSTPYPDELRSKLLLHSRNPDTCTLDALGELDQWIGECFRNAAKAVIESASLAPPAIRAIGSHGQTLRHQPRAERPFSLQIGDANIIASGTGITTVADFRRRDVALGGEGAPLAPAFHHWLFAQQAGRQAVVNIGGIANVTILHPDSRKVVGFDTGPGNTLLDGWIREKRNKPYDDQGEWAASGVVDKELLASLLHDPFFDQPPPKSTGFEYFRAEWVKQALTSLNGTAPDEADVQATLAELSAATIVTAVSTHASDVSELIVCGGGVHNTDLMKRLRHRLPSATIVSTESYGLDPDCVEAAAFAWLAKRRLEGQPGNLPSVTGASRPAVLGAIYHGVE